MSARVSVFAVIVLLAAGSPAPGLARNLAEACALGIYTPRQTVSACSQALMGFALSPPSRATLLNARGRAQRLIGEPARALADHDAALKANPASADAYVGRALARLDLGARGEVIQDLTDATDLSPTHAQAWRALGHVRLLIGDDDGALQALQVALELSDVDAEAHVFRGLVRYRLGRFAQALSDFERARVLGMDYVYLPLWQWLAAHRAGTDTRAIAETYLAALDGEWPAALLRVYQGIRVDPSVLDAAIQDDAARSGEAAFYLAEFSLATGRSLQPNPGLAAGMQTLAPQSIERAMQRQGGGDPERL